MKKYLALALLTCTGMSSLQAMQETASYAQTAAQQPRKAGKAYKKQQALNISTSQQQVATVAEDLGVSTEKAASALVALAVAQADQKDQEFEAVEKDLSTSTLQQEDEGVIEDLTATTRLTLDAKKRRHEAKKLRAERAEYERKTANKNEEYDRQTAANVETLKGNIIALSQKYDEANKTLIEKEQELKKVKVAEEASKDSAKKAIDLEKQAQAQFDAAQRDLTAAKEAKEQSEKDVAEKSANTLARSNSFDGHAKKAKELSADKEAVKAELLEHMVPETEIEKICAATTVNVSRNGASSGESSALVPTQPSGIAWLASLFGGSSK